MTNLLPFAESVLCWELAVSPMPRPQPSKHWLRIPSTIAPRLALSLILTWATGFSRTGFLLAGVILALSLALPWARKHWVAPRFLAEFENAGHGLVALFAWQMC